MEHQVSKVKVFNSSDYKRFVTLEGNRAINKKKIERIVKEIQTGNDVLDQVPVLVREAKGKLEVIDGQHRLEVAKLLKRPVHYILRSEEMSLYNVAKVNSNTEKWKDADFVNCYIKAGNSNYSRLKQFCKQYEISVGIAIVLLHNGTLIGKTEDGKSDEVLRHEFETGAWECRSMKEAKLKMELCKQFEEFSGWNKRAFIRATCVLMNKNLCDFDRLVKKFLRDPRRLSLTGNYKELLTQLEAIYNLDNQKRVPIH